MCSYLEEVSEIAIRMDMDSDAEISGIAFGYNTQCPGGYFSWYAMIDTPQYNTENYIFNIYDEWMVLLYSDTVSTQEFVVDLYVEAGFSYDTNAVEIAREMLYHGQTGYEAPTYIGICKLNFDTTIHVPETFYIGITSSTPIDIDQDTMLVITAFYDMFGCQPDAPPFSILPYETRRYRIAHSSGEEIQNWADEECHYGIQTCLYPILVLPCGEVTGLRCQAVGGAGTVALVEWDSGENNAAYEVSFGPQGTPPGEGTVTTVTVPRLVHSLDRNTHYDFYVRARCDLADTTWTAWSDPLHVHLATAGIDGAEPVDWSLTPNPAHGSAAVWCDEGIKSVELLTLKGERILYQDMAGKQACTLDLTGLSKGIYIVQITTPQGTAARKLAVE